MESGNVLLSRPFPSALYPPQAARGRKPKQVQCTHSPGDEPRKFGTISAPKRNQPHFCGADFFLESGNVLLSRPVSRQVPSALKGLTSVFGMGTGGSLSPLSPEFCQGLVQSVVLLASAVSISNHSLRLGNPPHIRASFFYCAYPENRTSRLFFILQRPVSNFPFGLNSILDQVLDRLVSSSSIRYRTSTDDLSPGSPPGVLLLSNGTLLLEVGFTLRCLQRLSRPHFASLLCRWHDNSCTSDASTPVLSY